MSYFLTYQARAHLIHESFKVEIKAQQCTVHDPDECTSSDQSRAASHLCSGQAHGDRSTAVCDTMNRLWNLRLTDSDVELPLLKNVVILLHTFTDNNQ